MSSILSAGIDIGTTTTQVVFSRLELADTGGFGSVPKIEIVKKDIIYKGGAAFTPLLSESEIDARGVMSLIAAEYKRAGIEPGEIDTGAVIITGETLKKSNAREVAAALSELSGDFVVASAGADLESSLSGQGAGAAALSRKECKITANLDIGGGTTNISVFKDGRLIDTACYDIGGRHLRVKDGKAQYISKKLEAVLSEYKIPLCEGEGVSPEKARLIAGAYAELLEQAAGLSRPTQLLGSLETGHALKTSSEPDIFTFSGGVADCLDNASLSDFEYGDLGVFLGRALRDSKFHKSGKLRRAGETLRATVIGAGNYSMELSGSTIYYKDWVFPVKNMPIIAVKLSSPEGIPDLYENAERTFLLRPEAANARKGFAIYFEGISCPSFKQIEEIAGELASVLRKAEPGRQIAVILREDMAKALGQALRRRLADKTPILCIDKISLNDCDYIDIGMPVSGGYAVPVIVKTLIFT